MQDLELTTKFRCQTLTQSFNFQSVPLLHALKSDYYINMKTNKLTRSILKVSITTTLSLVTIQARANSTSVLFSQPSISNIDTHLVINPTSPTKPGLFVLGQNVNLVSKDVAIPWAMGDFTNFYTSKPSATQRGPVDNHYGGTGFQAEGGTVGIIINGSQLVHSKTPARTLFPIVANYNFPTPLPRPFVDPKRMVVFSIDAQVPKADAHAGTAYANIHFLFTDQKSKLSVWVGGSIFDLRGNSVKSEFIIKDEWDGQGATHHAIVAGPITRPGEMFPRYSLPLASSSSFQPKVWKGFQKFRLALSHEVFKNLVADLRTNCKNCAWNNFSSDPADYALVHINYNPEVYYDGAHAFIATSFKNMQVTLEATAASPIYRFYNTQTQAHYYTVSPYQARKMESPWIYEGQSGQMFRTQAESPNSVPLYSLYNASKNNYFYTTSLAEKNNAIAKHGYNNDGNGIAGFLPPQGGTCTSGKYFYRIYYLAKHFYTSNIKEMQLVVTRGGTLEASYCLPQ